MKAFYVGPKALMLLEGGKRLAISAHSPREFDLVAGGKLEFKFRGHTTKY